MRSLFETSYFGDQLDSHLDDIAYKTCELQFLQGRFSIHFVSFHKILSSLNQIYI